MGKVGPIVMIVFSIIVMGVYYHVWDECIVFLDPYIVEDEYYDLIRLGWDIIPVVVLLIGIIWLIKTGVGSSRSRVVYE